MFTNKELINLICDTVSHLDSRLILHGERVAFTVSKILKATDANISAKDYFSSLMLAVMHDIGAYKTEQIDKMVEFETSEVKEHSVYGFLFLKIFSPLSDMSDAILLHHSSYKDIHNTSFAHRELGNIIYLADRVDILLLQNRIEEINTLISSYRDTLFSGKIIDVFLKLNENNALIKELISINPREYLMNNINLDVYSTDELKKSLLMIIYFIDFRSLSTVTHTISTAYISVKIGKLLGLDSSTLIKIRWGALLHDIGKIATPIDILHKAGTLDDVEMEVMKEHVNITAEILGKNIDPDVVRLAVNHHEKLNGLGYPQGIISDKTDETIVQIADIVSALADKRSYKNDFDKDKIIKILLEFKESNRLRGDIIDLVIANFDSLNVYNPPYKQHLFNIYDLIASNYTLLLKSMTNNDYEEVIHKVKSLEKSLENNMLENYLLGY